MKIRAVVHSTQSSIMADYNRELFERYHLLFIDPTYGTGSEAAAEEKMKDYMESSLNGENDEGRLYEYTIEEIALTSGKTIIDDNMSDLKKQIVEYEKEAGVIQKVTELGRDIVDSSKDIAQAGEKTEQNAVEIPGENGVDETPASDGDSGENGNTGGNENSEENIGDNKEGDQNVEDPRDVLKNNLKLGILALVLPEHAEISREKHDFSDSVSKKYTELSDKEKDNEFNDITKLVDLLGESSKEDDKSLLNIAEKAAFSAYVADHFSYQGKYRDSVMKCEAEYIIKGKDNDYDNLSAVVSDIVWMRMPVNYVCIIRDTAKQSEALALATSICTATGTMPMVEIVKYLLLGCWSYGESIYEVRQLMHGEKIPYIKTSQNWNTDLKTLSKAGGGAATDSGMDYKDFLYIMLAKKESRDITYARMLDLIEKNLRVEDDSLTVVNLCGALTVEGKVSMNPLLVDRGDELIYEYYFDEEFEY